MGHRLSRPAPYQARVTRLSSFVIPLMRRSLCNYENAGFGNYVFCSFAPKRADGSGHNGNEKNFEIFSLKLVIVSEGSYERKPGCFHPVARNLIPA